MRFHALQRFQHLCIRYPKTKPQVHSLRSGPLTNLGMQQPITYGCSKLVTVISRDQGNHHVESGNPSGTSDPVTIKLKQRSRKFNLGKRLLHRRDVLPVRRAPPSSEQTRLRDDHGPARNAADNNSAARKCTKPGESPLVVEGSRVTSCTNEQDIERLRICTERKIRQDGRPVGSNSGLIPWCSMPPAIKCLSRYAVSGSQRLNRRGIRHQRKSRNKQEANSFDASTGLTICT